MAQRGGASNNNGDILNGPVKITSSYLDFDEISTPANPSGDDGRLYVKDDGGTTTLFFRDSAGTETNLLSGGGSGDVVGPASSVDNRLVTFNSTTGKLIQDDTSVTASLVGGTGGINTFSSADRIKIESSTTEAGGIDIETSDSAAQVRLGAAGTLRLNANKSDVTALVMLASAGGSNWQTTSSSTGANGQMTFTSVTTDTLSGGGALFSTLCNNASGAAGDVVIESRASTTGALGGDVIIQTALEGGATTAGKIQIISADGSADALDMDITGGVDVDATDLIDLTTTSTNAAAISLNASTGAGGISLNAGTSGINLNNDSLVSMGWQRNATAADVNTTNESIVGVTSTAAPRTITLDTDDVVAGRVIWVVDESGGAGTNNITIDTEGGENINGGSSVTIDQNYGRIGLYSDGSNWFTLMDEGSAAVASGDVTGPGSSVDNRLVTFDSTTGKVIQDDTSITAVLDTGDNLITSSDEISISSTDTTATAIDIDSSGGIDIDAAFDINIATSETTGEIIINSASTVAAAIAIQAASGGIDMDCDDFNLAATGSGAEIVMSAGSSGAAAFDLDAASGGFDLDVAKSIDLNSSNSNTTDSIVLFRDYTGGATSTGGISITSEASVPFGSSGPIAMQTTATGGGNAGKISINSGSLNADAIDIDSAGGIDIDAAGDFNVTLTGITSDIQLTTPSSSTAAFDLNATAGGFDLDVVSGITMDNTSSSTLEGIDITSTNTAAVLAGNITITTTSSGSGTGGGNIILEAVAGSGAGGKVQLNSESIAADAINIDSSGGVDVDAAAEVNIATSQSQTQPIKILATAGGMQIKSTVAAASRPLEIHQEMTAAAAAAGIDINTDSTNAGGTGGDISVTTTATSGTPGKIDIDAANTSVDALKLTSAGGIQISTSSVGIDMQDSVMDQMAWKRRAVGTDFTTTGEPINAITNTAIARQVTLASADVAVGKIMIVKDESGGAGTNNITVATQGAENIDGASTLVISANYGVARLYSDGTNWFTL